MLRVKKVYHTMEEGNSATAITETVYFCDTCQGTGLIPIERKDLINYMEAMNFKQAMLIYRAWKDDSKQVECRECQGRGEFEEIEYAAPRIF